MKKKKLFAIVMIILMIACFMPTMAFADPDAAPAATNDTVVAKIGETEYTDLHTALEAAKNGGTVVLQSDITLTGEWTPIGEFKGTLDGNNKTIYGLSITSGTTNIGLFTKLTYSTVRDLTIANAKIDLSNVTAAQSYIGVLAGDSWGSAITNVTVENAIVSTEAKYVGGICGAVYGSITDCTVSDSVITGKDQVGGLVGYYWIGTATKCLLKGNTITATEERAGGIVGKIQTSNGNDGTTGVNVTNCTVSGGSANAPDRAGGIAAQLMGNQNVYSITGNTVENFTLNAEEEKSALATIRRGEEDESFFNALGTNVTGNTLEDISSTLDESWKEIYTYDKWVVYQRCEAKIDSVKYVTIAKALSAAQAGGTVTLLKNVTIKSENTISNNIIIDLNGKTLSGEGSRALTVSSGATLTIQDSKGGGMIGASLIDGKDAAALSITGGTFTADPSAYVKDNDKYIVKRSGNADNYTYVVLAKQSLTGGVYLTDPTGSLASRYYVSSTDGGVWTVSYAGSGSSSSTTTTTTDNVTNTAEDKKTDTSADPDKTTETAAVATTTATVKAETKTATDGTKTVAATVDTTTADKIVEKAISNTSKEVVVNAATAETVTETAAGTSTEIELPELTVQALSEKTEASVTIKSDAAEVTLDKVAVDGLAAQAGDDGYVKLVVETVKQEPKIMQVDLKLVTSKGTVSDFRGGNVSVTVKLNDTLATKEVTCVYINDGGIYHKVSGAKSTDGTYTFVTGHFSSYAIMALDEADGVIAEQTAKAKELADKIQLKARSVKTAKGNIKVTLKITKGQDSFKALEDMGYTLKYQFYRSTEMKKNYKYKFETLGAPYTNTDAKKGNRYYYKARIAVYDTEGNLVTKTDLKKCWYATRIR